ncbi:hypothetical protein [Paracoccus sp. NBH48]|uniref:hypothetical protein n=1 Tax=Paracoccus sp. NBH48 TaxID=2596918 RepID=UPI002103C572|nr:hypothetical protein [Paracoccus sp. NBH48]
MAVAPAISDWLGRVVASDRHLAGLTILPEHGAAIVARELLGGRLAAIRRSPPPPGAMPLSAPVADTAGRARTDSPWLAAHGTHAWTARLLTILQPVWRMMTHHGIALRRMARTC